MSNQIAPITVIKVSGHELDDDAFLGRLCDLIAERKRPTILVHGGGKEISLALGRYAMPSEFVDGLRVTTPESMGVVEMVLSGGINKRIVARLGAAGAHAVGLSGVDLGLLRCRPYEHPTADLGRVGTITQVHINALTTFLEKGWIPVISPIALGEDDHLSYNVNADQAAQNIGQAIVSDETIYLEALVFVSNVPGVMSSNIVIPRLTLPETEELLHTGVIHSGMAVKVRAAMEVVKSGIPVVRICDLQGLNEGGTAIVMDDA